MKNNIVRLSKQRSMAFLNNFASKQEKSKISKQEAESLLNSINNLNCKLFQNVVLFIQQKAYFALGYSKPSKALNKAHSLSPSYVSKLLKSANIYLTVDSKCHYLKYVSENTFRCCAQLDEEDLLLVWNTAVAKFDPGADKRITEKHMLKAMKKLALCDS